MDLTHGGHLTHGSPVNFSGKFFKVVPYGVRAERRAHRLRRHGASWPQQHRPKMIVVGDSAYPREIDFAPFRAIADEVGAVLMVDIAHFAGLVAAGIHPSPGAARRLRHHDDAQDPARPARRHDPVPRGVRQEPQLVGLPRQPGRPADARHRRQGGGVRRSAAAGVQGLPAADRRATPRRWPRRCMRHGFRLVSGGTDNHLHAGRPARHRAHRQGRRRRSTRPASP